MRTNLLRYLGIYLFLLFFYLLSYFFSLAFRVFKKYQKRIRKKDNETLYYIFLANKKLALLSAKRACKGGIIMKKIIYCFALYEVSN